MFKKNYILIQNKRLLECGRNGFPNNCLVSYNLTSLVSRHSKLFCYYIQQGPTQTLWWYFYLLTFVTGSPCKDNQMIIPLSGHFSATPKVIHCAWLRKFIFIIFLRYLSTRLKTLRFWCIMVWVFSKVLLLIINKHWILILTWSVVRRRFFFPSSLFSFEFPDVITLAACASTLWKQRNHIKL